MKISRALVSAPLLLLGFPAALYAQDAAKIVDQYIKAAGGAKNLASVRTLSIEGTFTGAPNGTAGSFTFETKLPNRYYLELAAVERGAADKSSIEAYSGKSSWQAMGGGAATTPLGEENARLEAAAQYYNTRLLNLKKNKTGLSLMGHAPVRGRDTWQIEISTANGVKREVYFDAATHLIAEEKTAAGGVERIILYSDYRSAGGVMLPYRIELRRGADVYPVTVTRAEVNGAIDDSVFDFPKKSQVQLPDLSALFQKIDGNQKVLRKLMENYAGTRTEEETQFDGAGKVKKVETNQYTFFFLNGEEVSTLVRKDGKALGEEEQRKENEKTRKRIEELQKREAKKERDEEQGKADKNGDPGIEVFLRACRFSNPRRERFRGQDVLVFDFEPNPAFHPHKMEEQVVQRLAGVVWVDEKALNVARLEAHFVGDLRIGAGLLANVQKGTSFIIEQAFINNEVWLPTYEEAQVGVRVLLMKGFRVGETTRYSDYKRFDVQTLENIGKPKQ